MQMLRIPVSFTGKFRSESERISLRIVNIISPAALSEVRFGVNVLKKYTRPFFEVLPNTSFVITTSLDTIGYKDVLVNLRHLRYLDNPLTDGGEAESLTRPRFTPPEDS
jgi:hypothetical protein